MDYVPWGTDLYSVDDMQYMPWATQDVFAVGDMPWTTHDLYAVDDIDVVHGI